jgi:hypothetical protein
MSNECINRKDAAEVLVSSAGYHPHVAQEWLDMLVNGDVALIKLPDGSMGMQRHLSYVGNGIFIRTSR